jgi:tetratricopeptide (TPR) repeat protein
LKFPDYHAFLKKKYPRRWADPPKNRERPIEDLTLLQLVTKLTTTNQVYYLHPSFGYYFELLYPEPHGLVNKLKSAPVDTLIIPPLPKEVVEENEKFWGKTEEEVLKPLSALIGPTKSRRVTDRMDPLAKFAQLKKEPNRDALTLAVYYSRALDSWGVEMQRNGQLARAAAYFERASELNRDNVVARVNLECNKRLQAGRKTFVQITKSIEDEFGNYSSWDQVMGANGPFDEPKFCYEEGRVLAKNGLYRQAANQFDRVKTLAPDNLPARLLLAELHVRSRLADQALKIIEDIHAHPETLPVPRTNETELLSVEASAYLAKNDLKGADAAVRTALEERPTGEDLKATAIQVYMDNGRWTNALELIEKQLTANSNYLPALVNKGYATLQLGQFDEAIPALTRVLAIETNKSEVHYSALLNRAIAYLRSEQLDESRRDYEVLQKAFPTAYRVYYGLSEIAYRMKDTNAAVRSSELYLANSPTNSDEYKFISARLKELKPR